MQVRLFWVPFSAFRWRACAFRRMISRGNRTCVLRRAPRMSSSVVLEKGTCGNDILIRGSLAATSRTLCGQWRTFVVTRAKSFVKNFLQLAISSWNWEHVAQSALSFDHSYVWCGVHSDFDVWFGSGKTWAARNADDCFCLEWLYAIDWCLDAWNVLAHVWFVEFEETLTILVNESLCIEHEDILVCLFSSDAAAGNCHIDNNVCKACCGRACNDGDNLLVLKIWNAQFKWLECFCGEFWSDWLSEVTVLILFKSC